MEISHTQIVFTEKDVKKEIFLTNNSESLIIFKIKSNIIQNPRPSPCRGFVELNQTITITIPQVKTEAKLLFNWALIEHKSEKFDQTWKKITPSSLSEKIIPVIPKPFIPLNTQKNNTNFGIQEQDSFQIKSSSMSFDENVLNSKSNSNSNQLNSYKTNHQPIGNSGTSPLKKTNSINDFQRKQNFNDKKNFGVSQIKITETKILKEEIRPMNYANAHVQNQNPMPATKRPQKENHMQSTGIQFQPQTGYHQMSQSSMFQPSNVEELSQLCFVQSQLLMERQQSERLKEELRRRKQMERERDQMMRQYNINRSMREECENDGTNWQGMMVMALIFLTVGFLISRF